MMIVYPRETLSASGQHGHSPQRHTTAGTAAPTTYHTPRTTQSYRASPPSDIGSEGPFYNLYNGAAGAIWRYAKRWLAVDVCGSSVG